jgi:hypothetical protein
VLPFTSVNVTHMTIPPALRTRHFLQQVVVVATTVLGAAAALPTMFGLGGIGVALAVVLAFAALFVVWAAAMEIRRLRIFPLDRQDLINGYMERWINHRGRVVIFTRDMSWAGVGTGVERILIEKARSGDLTICMPVRSPLATRLESAGAVIFEYGDLGFPVRSRFTIIRHEAQDARVAIGRSVDDVHMIEEFDIGEHPAFTMADDLVSFARILANAP